MTIRDIREIAEETKLTKKVRRKQIQEPAVKEPSTTAATIVGTGGQSDSFNGYTIVGDNDNQHHNRVLYRINSATPEIMLRHRPAVPRPPLPDSPTSAPFRRLHQTQATNIVKQKLQVSGPYGESKYAPSRPAPLTNANNGVVARRSAQLDQLRAPAPYGSIPPVRFYAKPPVAPSARPLLPSIEISRRNVERPVGSAVTHEHEPRSNLASGRLAQAMQAEINARPVRHPVRQELPRAKRLVHAFHEMGNEPAPPLPSTPPGPNHRSSIIPTAYKYEVSTANAETYRQDLQGVNFRTQEDNDVFGRVQRPMYNRARVFREGMAGPSHEVFRKGSDVYDEQANYGEDWMNQYD